MQKATKIFNQDNWYVIGNVHTYESEPGLFFEGVQYWNNGNKIIPVIEDDDCIYVDVDVDKEIERIEYFTEVIRRYKKYIRVENRNLPDLIYYTGNNIDFEDFLELYKDNLREISMMI